MPQHAPARAYCTQPLPRGKKVHTRDRQQSLNTHALRPPWPRVHRRMLGVTCTHMRARAHGQPSHQCWSREPFEKLSMPLKAARHAINLSLFCVCVCVCPRLAASGCIVGISGGGGANTLLPTRATKLPGVGGGRQVVTGSELLCVATPRPGPFPSRALATPLPPESVSRFQTGYFRAQPYIQRRRYWNASCRRRRHRRDEVVAECYNPPHK